VSENGEQQRITVERDFKSHAEMDKFLKEMEEGFKKKQQQQQQQQSKSSSKSDESKDFKNYLSDRITPG
jgi:hypothetical protein